MAISAQPLLLSVCYKMSKVLLDNANSYVDAATFRRPLTLQIGLQSLRVGQKMVVVEDDTP